MTRAFGRGAIVVGSVLIVAMASVHAQSAGAFMNVPNDVDPQSGFRLPPATADGLDAESKAIYERIVAKGGAGILGPGAILLHSPKTADLVGRLNAHLRFEAGLAPHLREIVILTVAREMDNQLEWSTHEPVALREGVDAKTIDAIRNRQSTAGLPETDAIVIELGRQAIGRKKVTPATFARAKALFPPQTLVNLVTLMGEYTSIAILLTTFDMQLLPDWKPTLPLAAQ